MKWVIVVASIVAVLGSSAAQCVLQERRGLPEVVSVTNQTDEQIWIASTEASGFVILHLEGGESHGYCLRGAGDVSVYGVDPTEDPHVDPLFTLSFGDGDFCEGVYVWDGSTLELRTE